MTPVRREKLILLVTIICVAGVVLWSVLGHGLPALRHDWRIPADQSKLLATFVGYISPWLPQGFGESQPYPTFYLIAPLLAALAWLGLPAIAIIAVTIAASIGIAAVSAFRIAFRFGATASMRIACVLIGTLNPWVFSKFVAGHIYMVAAYAFALGLIGELLAPSPNRARLVLYAALAITQLEFALILFPVILIWSIRRRYYTPLLAFSITAFPICFGLVAHLHAISQIPFLLPWQRTESVPLGLSIFGLGYAFNYAAAFSSVAFAGIPLALMAAIGLRSALRQVPARWIIVVSALLLVFASGTSGPIGPLYTWGVLQIKALGVFRELYDLVAITPVLYIVSLAHLKDRRAGFLALLLTIFLALPWAFHPAFRWFVSASAIPASSVKSQSGRIAYVPEFQPFSLDGKGSGVDPDAYATLSGDVPLNSVFPTYPVNRALGMLLMYDDPSEVAALGVDTIATRPYLQSNLAALAPQMPLAPVSIPHPAVSPHTIANAIPLLSLWPSQPMIANIGDDLWRNDLFVGDVPGVRIVAVRPSFSTLDASKAWVDASLAVPLHPELGNPLGGALTTSRLPLTVKCGDCKSALAIVRGALYSGDEKVVRNARAFEWLRFTDPIRALRCDGFCAIAAVGNPPGVRPFGASATFRSVVPHFYTWLILSATVSGPGTLRFNTRFSPNWDAFAGTELRPLAHVRIDGVTNGWPVAVGRQRIFIVNVAALVELLLELAAFPSIIFLLALSRGAYR